MVLSHHLVYGERFLIPRGVLVSFAFFVFTVVIVLILFLVFFVFASFLLRLRLWRRLIRGPLIPEAAIRRL